LKNSAGRHFQNGHHNTSQIQHCPILFDVGKQFRTLKSNNVECVRIVATILKMATGRNFSMSGINLGHHNLPTYEMSLKSENVEFVRYCGDHFENGDYSTLSDIIKI
jgi:hypothetical protein